MQSLDPFTFPLSGSRLIEASAGTGKTYTISTLYLRLMLEMDVDISEILVVTFTEAATQELRERIRRRIRQVLVLLEDGKNDDELMSQWVSRWREKKDLRQTLSDALVRMDEAAIFTIHGFCQRMLQDNAFETGTLFESEFITDEGPLQRSIIEDFWRRNFYALSPSRAQWVASQWRDPAALWHELRNYLKPGGLQVIPERMIPVSQLERSYAEVWDLLREHWADWRNDVIDLLSSHRGLSRSQQNYAVPRIEQAVAALDRLITASEPPSALPAEIYLLAQERIAGAVLKKKTAPEHVCFTQCQSLFDLHDKLTALLKIDYLARGLTYLEQERSRRKSAQGVLSFDDLLLLLDQALKGQAGVALGARIRKLYPRAMIDEFQDTDPLQYGIFRRIYRGFTNCSLFMIGDPKQAIYSFRGADIFTYIDARRGTATEDRFTLGINHRSTIGMVAAVNRLFAHHPRAFVYDQDIPFVPVRAAGKIDDVPLRIQGETATPLTCWWVERNDENSSKRSGIKRLKNDWWQTRLPAAFADEILRLLELGRNGRASLGARSLQAQDMAVLVRNRHEAGLIQQALREKGVASVFFSRDSVFETREADELERFMAAMLEPANELLLRSALATELMGLNAAAIDNLSHDEHAWEAWLNRMADYQARWWQQGFMSAFQALLHELGSGARLRVQRDGERRLTNLMHLAELIQTAPEAAHGPEHQLRWFSQQRLDVDGEDDRQQLRLESDEDLVKIVTIHKSKGLEYPVVFLPFPWNSRRVADDGPLLFHDVTSCRLTLDLGSEDFIAHHQLAEQERLAEDLRLLYVAITRASHTCYLTWGHFNKAAESALGYLLHPDSNNPAAVSCMNELDDAQTLAVLESLFAAPDAHSKVMPLPAPREERLAQLPQNSHVPPVAKLSRRIFCDWRVTSYSAMVSGRGQSEFAAIDHDQQTGEEPEQPIRSTAALDRFSFHRGARAGSFMHALLEQLDFAVVTHSTLQEIVARGLERFGYEQVWLPIVQEWIGDLLNASLDSASGLRLRDIPRRNRLAELEFHFPAGPLSGAGVDALLQTYYPDLAKLPPLGFDLNNSFIRGFVDLVFEFQGRYYLADYKTNHLGEKPSDYGPAQLRRSVLQHRYDLQYLLYTLALHRYLSQRLENYRYQEHFGGVYYLYLRGMTAEREAGQGVYFDKPAHALIEALDRLCEGA